MTRPTRRGLLGASAAALAGLAGCSSIPFVGGDSSRSLPDYDTAALGAVAEPTALRAPATYPGPVPESLVDTHRERARDALNSVPEDPDVPNGAVTRRLRNLRERVAETLGRATAPADPTLGAVAAWQNRRADAVELAVAYRAATGDLAPDAVSDRRADTYAALESFRADWTYRGASPVGALATSHGLERELAHARNWLAPDRTAPGDPVAAPLRTGEAAAAVERGRAGLDTVTGLYDALGAEDQRDQWTPIAVAANRLAEAASATTERVAPFLVGSMPEPGAVLDRDVDGTPADSLFTEASRAAIRHRRGAEQARERGDYAVAVVESGRALAAVLATGRAVDAIRNGDVGVPPDAESVSARRRDAVGALRRAQSAAPEPVSRLIAHPWWSSLRLADERLADASSADTAVLAVGVYAAVERVAAAVPDVAARTADELQQAE